MTGLNRAFTVGTCSYVASWLACGLALMLAGCPARKHNAPDGSSGKQTVSPEQVALRVLVVDNAAWATTLREQWQIRSSDEELTIRTATSAELVSAKRFSADVVVYPAGLLGQFAERELIQPFPEGENQPENSPAQQLSQFARELLPTVRQCDVSWGRKLYAATVGSPQLVLLYRSDVLAKLELSVPQTWEEYEQAALKMADRQLLGDLAPADDQPWHGALEPTADNWAATLLLARTASMLRGEGQLYTWFDLDTMHARIAAPPFIESAQQMARLNKAHNKLTPAQVREAFFAGQCGMAITWPSAENAGANEKTPHKIAVGFAELPGSKRFYSFTANAWEAKPSDINRRTSLCAVAGVVASVTKEARRASAAFQFLAWLESEEGAAVLGPAGSQTTMFAEPQLSTPERWVEREVNSQAAAEYARVVKDAFSRSTWTSTIRIPAANEYLAALQQAVTTAIDDPDSASKALGEAAQQWNAITERNDVGRQRRAYQRSLGNDF